MSLYSVVGSTWPNLQKIYILVHWHKKCLSLNFRCKYIHDTVVPAGYREQPPRGALWVSGLVGQFVQTWPDSECSRTVQCSDCSDLNWRLELTLQSLPPLLARYDPFGVDVPLNFDNTHSHRLFRQKKIGRKLKVVFKWKDIYIENIKSDVTDVFSQNGTLRNAFLNGEILNYIDYCACWVEGFKSLQTLFCGYRGSLVIRRVHIWQWWDTSKQVVKVQLTCW